MGAVGCYTLVIEIKTSSNHKTGYLSPSTIQSRSPVLDYTKPVTEVPVVFNRFYPTWVSRGTTWAPHVAATSSPLSSSPSPLSHSYRLVLCSDRAVKRRAERRSGRPRAQRRADGAAREQGASGARGSEGAFASSQGQPRSCSSVDAATKGNPPRSARTTSAPGSLRLPEVAQRVVELLHHRHWWFGPWALGLGLSALGPHFEDDNRFNLKPIKIISVNEERKD